MSALDTQLQALCDGKLDEAVTGDARGVALESMKAKLLAEARKHVRVIKNTQYSFVQKEDAHAMTTEEEAAWAEASDIHDTECKQM